MRFTSLLFLLVLPLALDAQQATVRSNARLLSSPPPQGRVLATFRDAGTVQTGRARGGATQVTLQGWVHNSLIGAARDSFRISVRAPSGALLRASATPTGRVIARLENGMGLHQVSRRGEWVQVRRVAWVESGAVQRSRQASAPAPAPARQPATPPARMVAQAEATDSAPGALEAESAPATTTAISEDMTPVRRAELSAAPGGAAVGAVEPGVRLVPLARDRGWVRVRVEAWIPEESLRMADTALAVPLSAADIRADPEAAKGKPVRWEVQVLAHQTADQLRRDMRPDEPYLLARGPGSENALLYLALPPELAASARGIQALTTIVVTGRVRVGRSVPAGVPIIDVQSITRR